MALHVNELTSPIASSSLLKKNKTKVEIDCPLPKFIFLPNHKPYSIVSTLQAQNDNVALLVNEATAPIASALRKKKKPKVYI